MNLRWLLSGLILVFSEAALSEADGPDFWRVHLIKPGSFLNLRKGPSTEFEIIAKIPHNAEKLENLGCFPDFNVAEWSRFNPQESKIAIRLRWCRISVSGIYGWVHAKYLIE